MLKLNIKTLEDANIAKGKLNMFIYKKSKTKDINISLPKFKNKIECILRKHREFYRFR